jgi:paraquat-inducible protein A
MVRPDRRALQTVWALLLAGMVAYVPANLYPMLITRSLFSSTESTIVGGAVELAMHGAWFIAAVILIASVAIPLAKFGAIAWLATEIARGSTASLHRKHRLHTAVELIGRWSMIDVFVVAILAALVQLGFLASIEPGPAAAPFAASVVLTMLAAQRLDPRLIWMGLDDDDR